MSLLGISDLFWKILGSWENLRCSGEISLPGKTELFLRNFCSPVKSELFLWKFPSSCMRKQKPPVKTELFWCYSTFLGKTHMFRCCPTFLSNLSVLRKSQHVWLPGKNAPVLKMIRLPGNL